MKQKNILTKSISSLAQYINGIIQKESTAGLIMLFFAVLALAIANSPLSNWYYTFVSTPIVCSVGSLELALPFDEFVKEVLMVLFFFNVGMELKKEMSVGFLKERSQILTPLLAALFGMLFPAVIYIGLNYENTEAIHGWAVPCATDIAFALCILNLAGKNINPALKIFLLSIAVFDDIGAIIIIALFYGEEISILYLVIGVATIAIIVLISYLKISNITVYAFLGIILWAAFLKGGVSTSIAGVICGILIPYSSAHKGNTLYPINTNIKRFTPWVNFVILPLFAFTESGIRLLGLPFENFISPVALGVILGLFFGKQIGIFGTTYIMVKMKLYHLPENIYIHHFYGVSIISGIGFTMSLFISKLAFSNPELLDEAKLGIIISALLSGILGFIILRIEKKQININ